MSQPWSGNRCLEDPLAPSQTLGTQVMGNNTLPFPHRCWLWTIETLTISIVLYSPEDKKLFEMSQQTFQLQTEREVAAVHGCSSYLALVLCSRFLIGAYRCSNKLCLLTMIFQSTYVVIDIVICSMIFFNESLKVTDNVGFYNPFDSLCEYYNGTEKFQHSLK